MKQKKEQEKKKKTDTCKILYHCKVDHFNDQMGKTESDNKLLYKEFKTFKK